MQPIGFRVVGVALQEPVAGRALCVLQAATWSVFGFEHVQV